MIIYLTENLVNGKLYVGQNSNNNIKYLGGGTIIQKAIKKYRRKNFKKQVLVRCNSQEELDEQEIFWIDALSTLKPNGYNIELGGNGRGKIISEETKRKQSKVHKGCKPTYGMLGKVHTDETKKKLSAFNKGKTLSEEHKKKISESEKGKFISSRIRLKQSLSHKGKVLKDSHKKRISESMSLYWKEKGANND